VSAPAAAAEGLDPGTAVRRLFGCSVREGALTALNAALAVGAAVLLHRHAWLGLFGAIMLPFLLACLALLGWGRLFGAAFGWTGTWLALFAATAAGALLALPLYRWWMRAAGLPGLPDAQLLACAFGVGALMLGLPLWHGQTKARAQQLAALRHAALASELKALQAQVEPHFLYNTLANARYLAQHDPDRAAQMLEHLIAYLHSALPDLRAQMSTLGREFELAGHYLALMAIRFGERLSYRLDCPAALAAVPMPPLMLMTLVENAVRHGLEPQPGPVCIRLAARHERGALRISVADDGAGPGQTVLGSGVGLRNLRARLAALYGAAALFDLSRSGAGVTEACLALPFASSDGLP
jgi:signal transduction histidine kinase